MRDGWRWTAGIALATTLTACGGADGGKSGGNADEAVEVTKLDPALASHLPPGATMEMAENGRTLFVTCSVCHGQDAGGTQLGPSLRDSSWVTIRGTPAEIEQVIRDGVPVPKELDIPMPAMGGGDFDDAQIRDLTAYVYAISHSANR